MSSNELPTAEGFYESAAFPTAGAEYDPYYCDGEGHWWEVNDTGHHKVVKPKSLLPLYRLVPERLDAQS